MERYLLFAGTYYYPNGGFDDLVSTFAAVDLAEKAAEETLSIKFHGSEAWAQVVKVTENSIELISKFEQRQKEHSIDGFLNEFYIVRL